MAETPSGLTTSIRRKLQDGSSPEDIVQELVAGGLTQASAQRFVDRALVDDPTAPPPPRFPAAGESLDPFLHETTAATEAESAKTGYKPLIAAGVLMCGGILVTAVSYIRADVGERYIGMWGPIILGVLIWGKTIFTGREDGSGFAWRTAIASLAIPIVLAGAALGVVAVTPVEEEGLLQKQMDEIFDPSKAAPKPGTPAITFKPSPPLSAQPDVQELLSIFDNARAASIQCEMARRLGLVADHERAEAVTNLVARFGLASDEVKVCIARAVQRLDPTVKLP